MEVIPALPHLPFLHLYSFLMQLPCQPLKPLNVKCEAHLSFVSFFLVTPVLSGDKEFGLSLSQTCLLYSISQIPPFLSLCLCKATSLLKMPSTPPRFSRVSSCVSSVKCHLLWEAFPLHRVQGTTPYCTLINCLVSKAGTVPC